jgi:hypothetical protein
MTRVPVLAALVAWGLALSGCHGGHEDGNRSTNAAAEPNAEAPTPCYDCDGAEGIVENATLNAKGAAMDSCGGPVELIDNRGGMTAADYRCRGQRLNRR